MQITFIDHSSFIVELENNILLFDWYKGTIPALDKEKQIYVFSSHKHHDHFNKEIFAFMKEYEQVHYIFSKDIRLSPSYLERNGIDPLVREKITFVGKNQTYVIGEGDHYIKVSTLTSTDTGVAFVITCEDKTIYHAGDLNWWSWLGNKPEEEKQMEEDYIREVDKLKEIHCDAAFVVLDPRQEDRYCWGFDYFIKTVEVDKVFPMHCWGEYTIIEKLKKESCAKAYVDRIITIEKEQQQFTV